MIQSTVMLLRLFSGPASRRVDRTGRHSRGTAVPLRLVDLTWARGNILETS